MNYKYLFCVWVTFCTHASIVIPGNAATADTTFASPVGQVAFVSNEIQRSFALFAGALNAGAKEWAVSFFGPGSGDKFIPIALAETLLNDGAALVASPLYDKAIEYLSGYTFTQPDGVTFYVPAVVPVGSKKIFTIPKLPIGAQKELVLSTADLHDASGNVTGGIKGITVGRSFIPVTITQPNQAQATTSTVYQSIIAAAVKGEGQAVFADPASASKSGIAIISLGRNIPVTMDVAAGVSEGNKAALFDTSLGAISAQAGDPAISLNPATVLQDAVSIYWDPVLDRLFVGISVQANTSGVPGALGVRSVVVGRMKDGKLTFAPIAPFTALNDQNNQIIGSRTDITNTAIASVNSLTTMFTSTGLHYLIVNGGNDINANTGNTVYALPLVNQPMYDPHSNDALAQAQGHIAAFDSAIGYTDRTKGMITPATTPAQMLTNVDAAAVVGGAPAPVFPGSGITSLTSVGDTVYVSIAQPYATNGVIAQQPGVFASRAIFDNEGRIVNWTPWQRQAGTDNQILDVGVNAVDAGYALSTSSLLNQEIDTVSLTKWTLGEPDNLLGGPKAISAPVGFIPGITNPFTSVYGVQSLQDYSPLMTGFTGSMAIATGYRKVLAAITGFEFPGVPGSLVPRFGDYVSGQLDSTNDAFPVPADSNPATTTNFLFSMTGPVLTSLNAINVQTLAGTAFGRYLIVGGTGGAAILINNDGTGYATYPFGLQFVQLGNFTNVVQIVADTTNIYVLTVNALYRIAINPATLVNNTSPITQIASIIVLANNKNTRAAFTDLVVSGPLALLGTTFGLFRSGDAQSIVTDDPINWTPVALPESLGPVTKLIWASSTGLMSELVNGGDVSVFESFIGQYQARVNRLYIQLNDVVDSATVSLFNDRFVLNRDSYFVDIGQFRNQYATNGSAYITTFPTIRNNSAFISILPPFTRSGQVLPSADSFLVQLGLKQGSVTSSITQSAATGAWLIPGNFGLSVNE